MCAITHTTPDLRNVDSNTWFYYATNT